MRNHSETSPPDATRRDFLKTAALAAGASAALATLGGCNQAGVSSAATKTPSPSNTMPLRISGYDYDRVHALATGKVGIKGCTVEFETAGIGDMNTNIFNGPQSRQVTEIGLHPFMIAYANDHFRDYTLLPIFPLRVFRHKSIFIRTDRGIHKPADLRGKTIATPGYSSSSLTWIRGMVQDEYGIKPTDVQWVVANKDSSAKLSGKVSKQENILPKGVPIRMGPAGKDESDLLESGQVDALFHAIEPRAYIQGAPNVGRLFPDYRRAERAYYKKTGIFPIMHAVAIQKKTLQKHPWLAKAVFDAYSQSKQKTYDRMKMAWIMGMLPWFGQELAETQALMGKNFYSYGLEPNRKALETLFRYSHQQGLCSRTLTIKELFAPESLPFTEST